MIFCLIWKLIEKIDMNPNSQCMHDKIKNVYCHVIMTSFQWLKIFIIKQMWYLFHCFGSSCCICRVTPDKILLNALYNMTIIYTVDLCFKHTATWSIDCCLVCRLWFYGSMTLINLLQQVECVFNLFLFCFF